MPSGLKATLRTEPGVPLEGEDLLAGRRVPDPHRPIAAGGGEALAVGAEGHAVTAAGVPLEGEGLLAGRRVPDLHRLVRSSAEARRLPSGLNATLETGPVCPLRVRASCAGRRVPDPHRPVRAGGGEAPCRRG